jgi:hypothetical protein
VGKKEERIWSKPSLADLKRGAKGGTDKRVYGRFAEFQVCESWISLPTYDMDGPGCVVDTRDGPPGCQSSMMVMGVRAGRNNHKRKKYLDKEGECKVPTRYRYESYKTGGQMAKNIGPKT